MTLFTLLISSHNVYGQVASLKEQADVRHKHDYFAWTSPEVLQHFKLRWDDLIKEAARVGIDGDLTDKSRFYHFSVALVKYGHSDLVRRESAQRAAHVDVNPNYDIEAHYQTCIRLARIDTDTSTGSPNLREPGTALAATIGQQLKNPGRSGKGYVSDDSSIDLGSTTGSSASSGNANPVTQAYIEKQKKATGKSAKEIKSSVECNKCGKKGHIAPDCRSSGGKERKQPRNRSKNTRNRAGSIFASSLQTVDEAVYDDTYDQNQGGFVIDTAGVSSRINTAIFISTRMTSCRNSSQTTTRTVKTNLRHTEA